VLISAPSVKARRVLDAYDAWLDEIERELAVE